VFTTVHFSSPVHQHIRVSCVFKTDCRQDTNICWNFKEKKNYFRGPYKKKQHSLFRYKHHSNSPHTRLLHGCIAGTKASQDVAFLWESFNLSEVCGLAVLGLFCHATEFVPQVTFTIWGATICETDVVPRPITVTFCSIRQYAFLFDQLKRFLIFSE
jgi:hypothetical protein